METKGFENHLISVVGAVIFNKRRDAILVGQRAKGKKFPLKWEFIGGKVDDGEDVNKAVVREFQEEIGFEVKSVGLLGQAKYDYGGDIGIVRVYFIECQLTGSVVLANFDQKVYNDIKWVNISDIGTLDWIEADKEFANKLAVSLTSSLPSRN